MTRSLLLALTVSLGIHLSAASLIDLLTDRNRRGRAPRESADISPPKPARIILDWAVIPAKSSPEEQSFVQSAATVSAISEMSEPDPEPASDDPQYSPGMVAPRFIAPPDFSFIEHYPQKLNVQVTIRIYVSSAGLPERIAPIESYVAPAEVLDQLTKTLYRTRFYPATLAGKSVAAYLDLVIGIEPESEPQ